MAVEHIVFSISIGRIQTELMFNECFVLLSKLLNTSLSSSALLSTIIILLYRWLLFLLHKVIYLSSKQNVKHTVTAQGMEAVFMVCTILERT